jgi:hypothetical protein
MIWFENNNLHNTICSNYNCENEINRQLKIGTKISNGMILLCDDCLHELLGKITIELMVSRNKIEERE